MGEPLPTIDWAALLQQLREVHGMTMSDIAHSVDLSRESIRTYYAGIARPKHHDGEAIIALWMRVTHSAREAVPRMSLTLSAAHFREL